MHSNCYKVEVSEREKSHWKKKKNEMSNVNTKNKIMMNRQKRNKKKNQWKKLFSLSFNLIKCGTSFRLNMCSKWLNWQSLIAYTFLHLFSLHLPSHSDHLSAPFFFSYVENINFIQAIRPSIHGGYIYLNVNANIRASYTDD